ARAIRDALKAQGVPTSSLASLNELRRLAVEQGLTQFGTPLAIVPATSVATDEPEAVTLATGTYGPSTRSVVVPAPVPTVAHHPVPEQSKAPDAQAATLDLFGDEPIVLPTPSPKKEGIPAVSYEDFVDAYHQGMPGNPRVAVISEK